jgi:xanthine dehydrogenase accessory factor
MSTTIYNEIQSGLQRGERLAVVTVVKTVGAAPCAIGSKLLIRADGSASGNLAGPITDKRIAQKALEALQSGQPLMTHIHLDADQGEAVGSCGATLEVFIEILRPEPRLIIAGANYVAQSLSQLASKLDFRISIVDDRRDLAAPDAFNDNVQIYFGDIPQTIQELAPDESTWVVIVTRGHHLDKEALKAALRTRAAYVGMIGSQSKVKQIFRTLLNEGFTKEQLTKVHAPIGLDLGAETPDEIALSIAAEILMLRHKASGSSMKNIHQLLDEDTSTSEGIASEEIAPVRVE